MNTKMQVRESQEHMGNIELFKFSFIQIKEKEDKEDEKKN